MFRRGSRLRSRQAAIRPFLCDVGLNSLTASDDAVTLNWGRLPRVQTLIGRDPIRCRRYSEQCSSMTGCRESATVGANWECGRREESKPTDNRLLPTSKSMQPEASLWTTEECRSSDPSPIYQGCQAALCRFIWPTGFGVRLAIQPRASGRWGRVASHPGLSWATLNCTRPEAFMARSVRPCRCRLPTSSSSWPRRKTTGISTNFDLQRACNVRR